VKLYKGGIPARYGGRVSSVLDIYQKEGNSNNFNLTGGIGVLSTRLLAEGPIVKDKSSFSIGGRSSYVGLSWIVSQYDISAFCYELISELSLKIIVKISIFRSGYFGREVFNID